MISVNMLEFREIPEQVIRQAAEAIGGENNFRLMLVNGNIFRAANCEPVYLMNNEQTLMFCSSKETFGQRLN
jgi:hypothetical protein